jgi:nitric oxide dioxygenase
VAACPFTGQTAKISQGLVAACPFAGIVKQTAPLLKPHAKEIVDDLYPRMFLQTPELFSFFNPANQFADKNGKRMALTKAVLAYAPHVDDPEKIADAVEFIAHKHCGLGVAPQHYPLVREKLMASMSEVLGQDMVTPEMRCGWIEAVDTLAGILTDEEKRLYHMAESRRGGWGGVKEFRISTVRNVANECAEFTFVPMAGSGPIDFTAGQALTLHIHKQGATPRHYTVTNAPGKEYLQCCIKRVEGGLVSDAMHAMSPGDVVGIAAPFGVFCLGERPAVLLSAGIGITPMKSFLDAVPDKIRLAIHVDKSEAAHPFRTEFKDANVKTHVHYTSKSGRPSPQILMKDLMPFVQECDFFLCGPGGFLQEMKEALMAAGAKRVHCDVFGPMLGLD